MARSEELIIIGITGTLGAGKGTVVDYLCREKGFVHYSVRAFLLEEIRRRGLPENRDSMVLVANGLRKQHGPSYITDQLYIQAVNHGRNCIIESIRTPGEITSLRAKGRFFLLAVDALQEERYRRILERQSETDRIAFGVFIANEAREMDSEDPNSQNLRACIGQADFLLFNDGTREALYARVEEVLDTIYNTLTREE
jgi:dephospho-CoA kinase